MASFRAIKTPDMRAKYAVAFTRIGTCVLKKTLQNFKEIY